MSPYLGWARLQGGLLAVPYLPLECDACSIRREAEGEGEGL